MQLPYRSFWYILDFYRLSTFSWNATSQLRPRNSRGEDRLSTFSWNATSRNLECVVSLNLYPFNLLLKCNSNGRSGRGMAKHYFQPSLEMQHYYLRAVGEEPEVQSFNLLLKCNVLHRDGKTSFYTNFQPSLEMQRWWRWGLTLRQRHLHQLSTFSWNATLVVNLVQNGKR